MIYRRHYHSDKCAVIAMQGDPADTLPQLVRDTSAALLVTDYGPLRLGRTWRMQVQHAHQATNMCMLAAGVRPQRLVPAMQPVGL